MEIGICNAIPNKEPNLYQWELGNFWKESEARVTNFEFVDNAVPTRWNGLRVELNLGVRREYCVFALTFMPYETVSSETHTQNETKNIKED